MDKPLFVHDCENCQFQGHFFGHDVWICHHADPLSPSIIARFGDDGPDYASTPIVLLHDSLVQGGNIGGQEDGKYWTMPYVQWIFSDRSIPSTSAMILALTLKGIKASNTP